MGSLTFELLGGFEVRTDGGATVGIPTQKYRALLAFLAAPAGRFHPRDSLVALLWDSLPHEQARGALRQAIWALRRTLNARAVDLLIHDGDAIALDANHVHTDVTEFARAAAQSDVASLERAASLYRGAFLAGISARETPFEDWLAGERERLAQMALASLANLLALQQAGGDRDRAVQTALRLLALDPLQEDVHRTLMKLYLSLGRRGAALRQYQSCVAILERELHAEPEAETRSVYREIVREASTSSGARSGTIARRSVAAAAPDTPLVGRDREIAELRVACTHAHAGSGRVAAIVGEAGIGKSRLVAEAMTEAAAGGAAVVAGRAYESAQVLPFGPWADALRRGRLLDDTTLGTLPPAWRSELARFLPELGQSAAAPLDAVTNVAPLFEAVLGLLTAFARRSPLVIVLEDLHWADDMTLRLAAFVARALADLRILLIVTGREEAFDAGAPLRRLVDDVERDVPVVQIVLTPLAHEDTIRLVHALVRDRDERLVEQMAEMVFKASEGHPFMIVEMVRSVGTAAGRRLPASIALPQGVRRLIERRFESLTPPARHVLSAAAAISRDFDFALLRRACGLAEEDVVTGLEELVRRRLLHAAGEGFEFTHDRLRDVAYAQLIQPRRTLLHRRLADALVELRATDLTDHHAVIAAHYAEAGAWADAARHLYEAAQTAHDRLAYPEAVGLLGRALDALTRVRRDRPAILLEIDIRLRLFRCLNPLADARAAEHVILARTLIAEAPDDSREAIILVELAELQRFARDLDAALDAAERARTLASSIGDARLLALSHFQLGVAHLTRGAYRPAIAHLASTVERLRPAPLREQVGYPYIPALCRLSWAYSDLGDVDEARRYADEAMRVARAGDHAPSVAEASTATAVLCLASGQPAAAIPALERAADIARRWQLAYLRSFSASWLALAYARDGGHDAAKRLLDECEDAQVWEQVRLQWSRIVVRLGEGRLLLGDAPRAMVLADRGLELARSIGEPLGEIEARSLIASLALHGGPRGRAQAIDELSVAIAMSNRLGLDALALRLRGQLARVRTTSTARRRPSR